MLLQQTNNARKHGMHSDVQIVWNNQSSLCSPGRVEKRLFLQFSELLIIFYPAICFHTRNVSFFSLFYRYFIANVQSSLSSTSSDHERHVHKIKLFPFPTYSIAKQEVSHKPLLLHDCYAVNRLPSGCFPDLYDVIIFKCRVNRYNFYILLY